MEAAAAMENQPKPVLQTYAELCDELFGHRLLTLLAWHPATNDTQRFFSTRPVEYPVSARKPMGETEWGTMLLKQGRSWIGTTPEDIRWAFFDHALIESLGCGACLSVPVRWNGRSLAAVSMLGPEGSYRPEQLEELRLLSGLLVPALLHDQRP
jgi:hypothetical protein